MRVVLGSGGTTCAESEILDRFLIRLSDPRLIGSLPQELWRQPWLTTPTAVASPEICETEQLDRFLIDADPVLLARRRQPQRVRRRKSV